MLLPKPAATIAPTPTGSRRLHAHRAKRARRHSDRLLRLPRRYQSRPLQQARRRAVGPRAAARRTDGAVMPANCAAIGADGEPLHFDSTPVAQALRSGERVIGAELVIEQPDGTRVPVLMNVAAAQGRCRPRRGRRLQLSGIDRTQARRRGAARQRSRAAIRHQSHAVHAGALQPRHALPLHQRRLCASASGRRAATFSARRSREMLGDKGLNTLRPYIERVLRGEAVNFECNLDFPNVGIAPSSHRLSARARRQGQGRRLDRLAARRHRAAPRRSRDGAARRRAGGALSVHRPALSRGVLERRLRGDARRDRRRLALPPRLDPALRQPTASCALPPGAACPTVIASRPKVCRRGRPMTPIPSRSALPTSTAARFGAEIKAAAKQEGIGALAFIPLMAAGKLIGKFVTYYDAPREFTREDIELTLTLARQLGFGIERMRADHARTRIEAELRKLSERLEAEVHKRTLERDRIWNVSEDLLAVSNFEGYLPQHQSGLDAASRLERRRDQVDECQRAAASRRRGAFHRRPRAIGAGRADRAHGKSLPPQGRLVALAAMDHDRERRPDLCRRPACHRGEGSCRGARTRAAADRAFAEDGRHRAAHRRHRARLQQSADDRERPRAAAQEPS